VTEIVDWARGTLRFGNVGFVLIVLAIAAVLLYLRPRWGRRWVVAAALAFWFVSTPFGSALLITPLARGYHPIQQASAAGTAGAIVVLGGGIRDLKAGADALAYPSESTTLRVLEAARVFRLLDGRPLVVASGGRNQIGRRIAEAAVIADALSALGVPRDRIVVEDGSLTTQEQAVLVTRLLKSQGIGRFVLVTSPAHMSRAAASFRAQRADVVPSIAALMSDYRPERHPFLPNGDSLEVSDAALYEYAGLVYYWARGWLRPVPASEGR
jgi:uncharacterized SAM-binding protein YcdF (DUF218 family)